MKSRLANIFIVSTFLTLIICACNKPDNIGYEVLPESDIIGTKFTDTSTIFARTLTEDTLRTDEFSYNIIGNYTDPVFGLANAGSYSQLNLTKSNFSFGNSPVADSIVLLLKIKDYYGDTTSSVNFKVYQLDENIIGDSIYYSNKSFNYSKLIGEATFAVNPHDSNPELGVKQAPHLRIRLSDALAADLVAQGGTANFLDNAAFIKYFKGIYIKAQRITKPNEGYLISYDYKNTLTKMSLYYHNADTDSVALNFAMDDKCRVNSFSHDYTGSEVGNQLTQTDSTTAGAANVYVQSMAGVKTKIYLPFLETFGVDTIAINRAVLVIEADATDAQYPPHVKLAITGIDSVGKPLLLLDTFDGSNVNDGVYDATKKQYSFNITRFVQQVANKTYKNRGLYILATGASVNMYRTKLIGFNATVDKIKLQLNYSTF